MGALWPETSPAHGMRSADECYGAVEGILRVQNDGPGRAFHSGRHTAGGPCPRPVYSVYQMAEAALLAPSEMISFVDSMVAPLSLINALLIAVGSRMRSDVSRTFAELEDIWNAYGVFGKMDDE
jgi:hypothetical protein